MMALSSLPPTGTSAIASTVTSTAHQADPHQRARLRWRARRGLLENDILLTRFLDRHEAGLSDVDVGALTELLELSDNDLMDLILVRKELSAAQDTEAMQQVLRLIRAA
jgi:antitoxin CptB